MKYMFFFQRKWAADFVYRSKISMYRWWRKKDDVDSVALVTLVVQLVVSDKLLVHNNMETIFVYTAIDYAAHDF